MRDRLEVRALIGETASEDPVTGSLNASLAQWLIGRGVPFTEAVDAEFPYHLTREGGHSARRIVHVTDATGAAVQKTLIEHVRRTPNITVFEHHMVQSADTPALVSTIASAI